MDTLKRIIRLIPVLLITPLFLVLSIILAMGPIGSEPGGAANRRVEMNSFSVLAALWGWAWTGKYERF